MHAWNVKPRDAIALQKELAGEVKLVPLEREPSYIGGCDVSMNRFAKDGFAGFVTLTYPELETVDHAVHKGVIPFPYIPGLLSFREIPMLLEAWKELEQKPDVLLVDGIGIAHPRRLGIASHLGVLLDIPTVGVAKSVLVGAFEAPGNEPGDTAPLIDQKNGEIIGMALRTKRNVKPMFVSPGHRITLKDAVTLVSSCVRKHRIPEPTRAAHNLMNEYRRKDMVS
ncbi:MAG TPA: deoxyribonuclease V [Candidatus Paceibacterota bacterium]